MFFDLFFISQDAGFIESGVFYFIRQILLFHIMSGIIMGILVPGSVPKLLRPFVMSVLKMGGHRRPDGAHCFIGDEDRIDRRIALRR